MTPLPQSPQPAPPAPLRSARAAVRNVTAPVCPAQAGEPGDAQVSPPSAPAGAVTSTPRTVAAEGLAYARAHRWLHEIGWRRQTAAETFTDAAEFCAGVTAELITNPVARIGWDPVRRWADGFVLLRDRARRARAMPLPKTGETT